MPAPISVMPRAITSLGERRVTSSCESPANAIDASVDTSQEAPHGIVQSAMTFSKERNLEREAVVDERELLRDALRRSMGDATFTEVRTEFEKRVDAGEFIEVEKQSDGPS